MTICVVGAGAAGLAAARHLAAASIPFEVVERERDVGGLWDVGLPHSLVYHSTRFISSKPLTQFPDFPMPDEYPDYPDHTQALEYLRGYARARDLYRHIRFGMVVERAAREPVGGWAVTFAGGETRRYSGLVVAAGIHSVPNLPAVRDGFDGDVIHSCGYKSPEQFRNRRVLVVGAGNSGCDIAVEASRHAATTFLSVRRGYWYIPKYAFGRPIDQVGEVGVRLGLPLSLRRALSGAILRAVVGRPEQYGLPRPDHRLLESHPIVNSQILPALRRGEVVCKPDVAGFRSSEVLFRDGSAERIDLIVFATGYRVSFPFLPPEELNSSDGRPDFYLHVFHSVRDDLFILGMIQPDSGVWPLMDLQARAVASCIRAAERNGPAVRSLRALKQGPPPDLGGGIRYVRSERHRYEVEHSSYARRLRTVTRMLDG